MESSHNTFNKKLFSELISKIKGNRTLVKFSEATTISIAHLSRMINEKLDSPPSPETLKKLLINPKGNVSYEELMIAAGYIHEEPSNMETTECDSDDMEMNNSIGIDYNYLRLPFNEEHWKKYKSTCMSTILFNLSCNSYSWHITNGKDITYPNINEFSLNLIDTYLKNWTFQLKYINYCFKNRNDLNLHFKQTVIETLGQLAITAFEENSKISIVTDIDELYKTFIELAPKNLGLTISIILIQPEELIILKEQYVSYSHGIDVDKLQEFLLCSN